MLGNGFDVYAFSVPQRSQNRLGNRNRLFLHDLIIQIIKSSLSTIDLSSNKLGTSLLPNIT